MRMASLFIKAKEWALSARHLRAVPAGKQNSRVCNSNAIQGQQPKYVFHKRPRVPPSMMHAEISSEIISLFYTEQPIYVAAAQQRHWQKYKPKAKEAFIKEKQDRVVHPLRSRVELRRVPSCPSSVPSSS